MADLGSVPRGALERFAARMIAEHQTADGLICSVCHLPAPCPVEDAANENGLTAARVLYFTGSVGEWTVTPSDDGLEVKVETDWRNDGQGHIVVFDRAAVERGGFLDPVPLSPWTRAAWRAALEWASQTEVAHGAR